MENKLEIFEAKIRKKLKNKEQINFFLEISKYLDDKVLDKLNKNYFQ